jgi:hypothetical protein
MDPLLQDYPRKRARLRRANDGFWTPGEFYLSSPSRDEYLPQRVQQS